MTRSWVRPLLGAAAAAVLASSLLVASPSASWAQGGPDPQGSVVEAPADLEVSADEYRAEVERLVASHLPRTIAEREDGLAYTFHLTLAVDEVSDAVALDYTVVLPDEELDGMIQPMLSGGSNQHGPYIDLNGFDQDLLISGGAAAIGLAACAIPGIGWVSCAAITAGLTVAAVALSHNGKCPGQFRIYLNRPRDEPHYVCV